MFGVDMSKPGAQEYYDSVFDLFARWGVDFVKVDDISRPYHRTEIEAVRKAIDRTRRSMVLSLSPGETTLSAGAHVREHANMWRISDDFWDHWPALLEQFERLRKWTEFRGPGHFPDADMLPLGLIDMGRRRTRFSKDEQYTLMTLWAIARSPLIFGGDMRHMDDFTLSLITNEEVIAVDQESGGNHQLSSVGGIIIWVADVPRSRDKYVAVFNTNDAPPGNTQASMRTTVKLSDLGFKGDCRIRDLWRKQIIGEFKEMFAGDINWHGAGLYRLSPVSSP